MRKRFILFSFLFLLGLVLLSSNLAPIGAISSTVDNFNYDPVAWEDWTSAGAAPSGTNINGYEWEGKNNTLLLYGEKDTVTQWRNCYRDFQVEDKAEQITFSTEFYVHKNVGSSANRIQFNFFYHYEATYHYTYLIIYPDHITFAYINWAHSYVYTSEYSTGFDGYFNFEYTVRNYYIDFELNNDTDTIISMSNVQCEAISAAFYEVRFYLELTDSYSDIYVSYYWFDAPFNQVNGLREWHKYNMGAPTYENEYYIVEQGGANDYANILCMPFQSLKSKWYWSGLTASINEVSIKITPFSYGFSSGGKYIELYASYSGGVVYLTLDTATSGSWSVSTFSSADNIAFSVWIDKAGKCWFYIQNDASSPTDFWVYDVSSDFNFDSWGVRLEHRAIKTAGASDVNSRLEDVGIVYGKKEGVMQPEIKGNNAFWTFNPILALLIWLASVFSLVMQWLATAIGTVLAPLFYWIGEYLAPYIVAVVTQFVNNFITPFITSLFNWIITNFVNMIIAGAFFVVGVLNALLGGLSMLIWGDATVLPNAVAAIFTLAGMFLLSIGTFLVTLPTTILLFVNMIFGNAPTAVAFSTSGLSIVFTILYYVATYLPIAVFVYVLFTMLKCVNEQSIDPLIQFGFQLFNIAQVFFGVIQSVISAIWGLIAGIMELIPF